MEHSLSNNILTLKIDSKLYNEKVVHKCFYWYSQDFTININLTADAIFDISLKPKQSDNIYKWEDLLEKVQQDLVDFKLRDIVNQETQTIRELIVAKAFAYYETEDLLHHDVSDPVGFDPKNI